MAAALVQAFWQPSSSLTWWAGPRTLHKRRVYGLLRAMYVAMFHCVCCKILVWAIQVHLAHISKTTRARDLKFAGAVVQRL